MQPARDTGLGSMTGFPLDWILCCCLTSKLTCLPAYGAVVAYARIVTKARVQVQRIVRRRCASLPDSR